eukprot:scaffold238958_cov30-Tisochrysis_lutea.AAC.1
MAGSSFSASLPSRERAGLLGWRARRGRDPSVVVCGREGLIGSARARGVARRVAIKQCGRGVFATRRKVCDVKALERGRGGRRLGALGDKHHTNQAEEDEEEEKRHQYEPHDEPNTRAANTGGLLVAASQEAAGRG